MCVRGRVRVKVVGGEKVTRVGAGRIGGGREKLGMSYQGCKVVAVFFNWVMLAVHISDMDSRRLVAWPGNLLATGKAMARAAT